MTPELATLAALGHGLCAAAMLALLAYLVYGRNWSAGTRAMALAGGVSAAWSICGLAFVLLPSADLWQVLRGLEPLRAAAWLLVLLALLGTGRPAATPGRTHFRLALALGLVGAVVVGAAVPTPSPAVGAAPGEVAVAGLVASLGLAVAGLVGAEQLLRNVPARQRWGIWPLVIALGSMAAFDLYLYSDAVLLGQLDPAAWSAQAAVTACAAPLLAVAAARQGQWSRLPAVSHGAAFHTTVLLTIALYLLLVAALGSFVRYLDSAWGPALQLVLFTAALMVLGVLLTLGSVRAKLRVLIGKHFFAQRYDYRREWLRFTRLLAARDESAGIHQRCLQALADLVESPGGALWMRRDEGFRQVAQWNAPPVTDTEPADGPLAAFLARTGWVVDLDEHRRLPARYDRLALPAWLEALPGAWLVLPLAAAERLGGFVVLMSPRVDMALDWEVLDLLKTAGSEVALLLRQIEAEQALAEAEKFAAVNRMSTFVVHDLKNLVAQLSLMLRNAERHGENAEFRADMLDTVRHVVERMNGMLAQARLSGRPVPNAQAVELAALLQRVCEHKRAQHAGLRAELAGPVHALGHADRLEHVFAHIVQNAIDATPPQGAIRVGLQARGAAVEVEIADEGAGMAPEFLQQRLFRPFQTTKPGGMGIGMYESQHYVASLGGRMQVHSTPGRGTRVRIELPAAHALPAPGRAGAITV